jgi:hypothetical protein
MIMRIVGWGGMQWVGGGKRLRRPTMQRTRSLGMTTGSIRGLRRAAAVVAAAALSALLTGCYAEGGSGVSLDQHAWVSTSMQPKTITLRDTRTNQAVWSIDVPVGQKLVILFRENAAENGQSFGDANPDVMLWELMAPDDDFGSLHNKIPVPGRNDRKLDFTLRAAPELPPSMGGSIPKSAPIPDTKPAGAAAETAPTK